MPPCRGLTIGGICLGLWAVTSNAQARAEVGEHLFEANCSGCHGERASNPNNLFDLKQLAPGDRPRFEKAMREGKGQMPSFEGTFSDPEFDAVWAYVRSLSN